MRRQKLSTVLLSAVGSAKNKHKVNLAGLCVKEIEDTKTDKNGNPFRPGKILDSSGCVCNFMVWGVLSLADEVWIEDAIIDVMNVEVNSTAKRLDFRAFSQVARASMTTPFRKPRKLHMLAWKGSS